MMKKMSALVLMTLCVLLLATCSCAGGKDYPRIGETRVVLGENWYGSTSKDYYLKLVEYAKQGDKQAWNKARVAGILAGVVSPLTANRKVIVVDWAAMSCLVKIRYVGELTEYWTSEEVVIGK